MKGMIYAICGYAAILFIGGAIGFIKAGSVASLLTATLLAGFLLRYGMAMQKQKPYAYGLTVGTLVCILVFFGVRYFNSYQFMPAGLMIILTLALLGYLLSQKPVIDRASSSK